MKNSVLIGTLIVFACTFTSCRDTQPEKVVVEKEVVNEVEVKDDQGLLEEAAEEVDNEISEEIDKIGDEK